MSIMGPISMFPDELCPPRLSDIVGLGTSIVTDSQPIPVLSPWTFDFAVELVIWTLLGVGVAG